MKQATDGQGCYGKYVCGYDARQLAVIAAGHCPFLLLVGFAPRLRVPGRDT